jgi:HAD superfamily hydrolase (TIGR01490 family)
MMNQPNTQTTVPSSLVLFDLDGTLLPIDTDHQWGEFMVSSGWVDKELYRTTNDRFYEGYRQGQFDPVSYLHFTLGVLSKEPALVWQRRRDFFIQEIVLPWLSSPKLDPVLALLNKYRQMDCWMILATATNAFVARSVARLFGFEYLLSVEPVLKDGIYQGGFIGHPTFSEGKEKALDNWLSNRSVSLDQFESSFFYTDSMNDLPLLKRVTHPCVVSPDPRLKQYAIEQQWPIFDWFE